MFGLDQEEEKILRSFKSPADIQTFINKLEINFEEDGKDSCKSPRVVLRTRKAHCIEGAFLAALALRYLGFRPLVVDMKGTKEDYDHVIAVFKIDGKWGAISKTNHAVLRYREPVYDSIRELIMSYFHEYSDSKGNKTLREYSDPIDLTLFDNTGWVISEDDLWHIHDYIDRVRHYRILSRDQERNLRKQDIIEIGLDKIVEWKRKFKKARNN